MFVNRLKKYTKKESLFYEMNMKERIEEALQFKNPTVQRSNP